MLKNASGVHCYRYKATDTWSIGPEHRPDVDSCAGHIVAKEGPLPVGAHTWKVGVGGKPVERTLTVALSLIHI